MYPEEGQLTHGNNYTIDFSWIDCMGGYGQNMFTGYYHNDGSGIVNERTRIGAFKDPAGTMLHCDARWHHVREGDFYWLQDGNAVCASRHNNGTNMSMIDGHATWHSYRVETQALFDLD